MESLVHRKENRTVRLVGTVGVYQVLAGSLYRTFMLSLVLILPLSQEKQPTKLSVNYDHPGCFWGIVQVGYLQITGEIFTDYR